jgi:hypothetical protein
MSNPSCDDARMKKKSYALKWWWPRSTLNGHELTGDATEQDRLALFRHQVALAARRLALPVAAQEYAVATVDHLPATNIRPDIGRQAQEWAEQHRTPPRPPKPRREPKAKPPRPRAPWPRPSPATLEREALVVRLIEEEKVSIKEIAAQLGTTKEGVHRIYGKVLRRRRVANGDDAFPSAFLVFYKASQRKTTERIRVRLPSPQSASRSDSSGPNLISPSGDNPGNNDK